MGHPHYRPTEEEIREKLPEIDNLREVIYFEDLFYLFWKFCEITSITPYWRGSTTRGVHKVSMRYGEQVIHVRSSDFSTGLIKAIDKAMDVFIRRRDEEGTPGRYLFEVLE